LAEVYFFPTRDEKAFQSSRHDLFAAVKRSGARVEGIDLGEGSVGSEKRILLSITVPGIRKGLRLLARQGSIDI